MSQTGYLHHRRGGRRNILPVGWAAVLAAVGLGALGLFLGINSGGPAALVTGDFTILAASLLAGASCARAARRGGANAKAWTFMSVAAFIWAAGMAVYAYFGLAYNHVYPFPSLADALFIGYSVPAVVALFAFRSRGGTHVALYRVAMDAAVVAGSVLVVSWFVCWALPSTPRGIRWPG